MNIHIFHDDKFTNGAIEQFEKFYPNQNIYIVLLYNYTVLKYTHPNSKITTFHIREKKLFSKISHIVKTNQVNNLFIHYLDTFKASVALKLLGKHTLKFYWIFYGGDFYDYLSRYLNYNVLDNESILKNTFKKDLIKNIKYLLWFGWTTKMAMKNAFKKLDYFCFWNEYDYELFKNKVESRAQHKDFIYYNALGNPDFRVGEKKNIIMVNHSASPSGNHFFILNELKKLPLKENNYSILLPLSYGNKAYADEIEKRATNHLDTDVQCLRDFMPLSTYQEMLSEVKIAIFGMRRQEAAGNIFQLLNMGAKVFLREENTLFNWLKKRNFIVFSIENDYTELSMLSGLSEKQIEHNKNCYSQTFNTAVYKEMMVSLMD